MLLPSIPRRLTRLVRWLLATVIVCSVAISARPPAHSDDQPLDSVGIIDGEDIAVSGSISVEVVNGRARTILRNGSDVRVRSGNAHIDLTEGGKIDVCGPAHFSVLKSGGTLTVALESGAIHAHIEREPPLIIYTTQIQAHPIAVGDGPQDLLIGFDSPETMCVRANRGAVRIEQQFTGQTVVVPQTGDILLVNGQLENLRTGSGHCICELQTAKAAPTTQPVQAANGDGGSKNVLDVNADLPLARAEKPAPKEEPIYQVFMPPLIYDAKAKVQPEVAPSLMVLVRRVRVRPTLIFYGRVEGEKVVAAAPSRPAQTVAAAAEQAKPAAPTAPANDSFSKRVRNFVRKLWSR